LDFRRLPPSTIPQAILVTFIGVCVRTPVALLSTYGVGLSLKERLFIALSWIPKATVQAALASVPLDMVLDSMSEADEGYAEYVKWGKDILTTAVFSIILTAPIGLIVIAQLGPAWLTQDVSKSQHEQGDDAHGAHHKGKHDNHSPQHPTTATHEHPAKPPDVSELINGSFKANADEIDVEGATSYINEQMQLLEVIAGRLESGYVKTETAAFDLRKRKRRLEVGVGLLKESLLDAERRLEDARMYGFDENYYDDQEDEEKIVDTSSNFFRLVANQEGSDRPGPPTLPRTIEAFNARTQSV